MADKNTEQQQDPHLQSRVKHFVSRSLWRMQKSSALINLFFFSFTIGAIYIDQIPVFDFIDRNSLLLLIYIVSFSGVLLIGWSYDRVLRLWKEDAVVVVDRNQYQSAALTEKEHTMMQIDLAQYKTFYESMRTNMLICEHYDIPVSDLNKRLDELQRHNEIYAEWIEAGKITTRVV